MMTMSAQPNRRFYRDRDNAWLGGVCAGLAGYLGFNLKVTRFLAFEIMEVVASKRVLGDRLCWD